MSSLLPQPDPLNELPDIFRTGGEEKQSEENLISWRIYAAAFHDR
jgi:hypothetical protein